jgi:hypothetical protein
MNNFYELFDILPNASIKEIIMAYENKITKYNNIKKLSKQQIYDIKMLKIGLYILINVREKYNKIFYKFEPSAINSTNNEPSAINSTNNEPSAINSTNNEPSAINSTNNEPSAINSTNNETLDSLFNIDNSWMKNHKFDSNSNFDSNTNNDFTQLNKKKFETNISDRVFSLSTLNKRPGFSFDFEAEIRKPLQGREDKTEQKLNKIE